MRTTANRSSALVTLLVTVATALVGMVWIFGSSAAGADSSDGELPNESDTSSAIDNDLAMLKNLGVPQAERDLYQGDDQEPAEVGDEQTQVRHVSTFVVYEDNE